MKPDQGPFMAMKPLHNGSRSACKASRHGWGQTSHVGQVCRDQQQRGSVAIVFSAILGAIAVMVLSFSSLAVQKAAFGSEERMAREVEDALAQLQAWYERQADTIAVSGVTPTEAQLQAALTRPYPGMRLAMSSSMATPGCTAGTTGCIPWRKIAAWYPATQPPSATTTQDGLPVSEFTGDAIWRVYSSQAWYFDRFAQTQTKMSELSRSLMSWFAAKQGINPVSMHSANFWRASDCSNPGLALPCVDTYTSITTSGVSALLGLDASDVTPAVGAGIEFSNLQDSSTTAPYSVALRVSMPWGGSVRQIVLQP